MKPHPISEIFPAMEGADFDALVEDIKTHGLLQPLVMYQGKILDGRNRWRACEVLGIKPRWIDYEGNDPLGHVLSLNLTRRHLDASQRAMVAARMATLKLGANQHTQEGSRIQPPSQEEAARKMTVGRSGVKNARAVIEHGTPALVSAVDHRDIAVSVAGKIATAPRKVQREAVKNHGKNAPAIAKRIDEEKREEKPSKPPIDPHGLDVPVDVMAAAAKEQELVDKMDRLLAELNRAYTAYQEFRGERAGLKTGQHHSSALKSAFDAFSTIRLKRPESVCLNCKLWPGLRKTCASCRGTGYIDKAELKAIEATGSNPLLLEGDEAGVWIDGKWKTLNFLRGDDFS